MRGAVFSSSLEGLRTLYVTGMVMRPVMVSTKKGKNWPFPFVSSRCFVQHERVD